MKSLGELMFNLKEDPEKERIRQKHLSEARAWEESEPTPRPAPQYLPPPPPPPGLGPDPLQQRLQAALPALSETQRHMLETLLGSWGY